MKDLRSVKISRLLSCKERSTEMSDALQETIASHKGIKSCLMAFQTIQTVLLHLLSYFNLQSSFACLFLFLYELPHRNKAILQSCLILLYHSVESRRAGEEVFVIVKMRKEGMDLPFVFGPSVRKRLLKAEKDLDPLKHTCMRSRNPL